jgi:hypothetical protein
LATAGGTQRPPPVGRDRAPVARNPGGTPDGVIGDPFWVVFIDVAALNADVPQRHVAAVTPSRLPVIEDRPVMPWPGDSRCSNGPEQARSTLRRT